MNRWVTLDFETASTCDLLKCGAWRYSEDFSTFLTHIGYKPVIDGVPQRTIVLTGLACNKVDPYLYELASDPTVIFSAHNASFEQGMWEKHMVPLGYPPLGPERWHDTMASAAMHGLPLGLDAVTTALDLPIKKDMEGHRLMLKMCKPDKDGGWSHHTDENMRREAEYNVGDVDSQFGVYLATQGLGASERQIWIADQRINQRGILIDIPFVHACMDVLNQVRVPMTAEFRNLTGGLNPTQREKILNWVNDQGVTMGDMTKATLDAMLDPDDSFDFQDWDQIGRAPMPPHVHRVLELRRSLASSSVAKLERMLRCVGSDGRVRYTMQYHGAQTGRWSGRLIQIQNYPRGEIQERQGLTPEILADAIMTRDVNRVRELWGNDIFGAIISSLRSCIIPSRGNVLVVGDYAQVEARNVLSFAGEHQRAIEFDTTDAYAELGAMIFKHPVNKKDNPRERQIGKNGLLGCLASDTQVLTDNGWKAIIAVSEDDKLWDGIEFVTHQGLAFRGNRQTLNLSGLRLTNDHLVYIGDHWLPAEQVGRNTLCQALDYAAERLPSSATPIPRNKGPWLRSYAAAIASPLSASINILFGRVGQPGAINVRSENQAKHNRKNITVMQTFALRLPTERDFLTELQRYKRDAKSPDQRRMHTTVREGLGFTNLGEAAGTGNSRPPVQDGALSSLILSHCLGGTTRRLKSTGSRLIGAMSRGTSDLLRSCNRLLTNVLFSNCKNGSLNLNKKTQTCEPVWDLVNAGPRNRFCVMTSKGPIIVHNSGYGLGPLGFQAKFAPNEPFELAQLAINTYRKDFAPLVPRFWYGLFEASVKAVWCNESRTYEYAGIEFRKEGDFLTMRLPSERKIWYHRPERAMSFNPSTGQEHPSWTFLTYQGKKTRRTYMWYGQLMNNLVQGSAADLVRNAILLCEANGLPVVFTAHDEIVSEVQNAPDLAVRLKQIMEYIPQWAIERRFNVKAETDIMRRYRK